MAEQQLDMEKNSSDSSGAQIDLTLSDDDVDMAPQQPAWWSTLKITPSQRRQLLQICKSDFGRKFQKKHLKEVGFDSIGRSLSSMLDWLEINMYVSLDEAARDAINILDKYSDHFQQPEDTSSDVMVVVDKSEMICMADHLKGRFSKLLDPVEEQAVSSAGTTEDALMNKLLDIFPNMELNVLTTKTKNYLENNSSENVDISMAINEISQLILEESQQSLDSETSELQHFPLHAPETGKLHDFEEQHGHHYYIAASQFYKMLHRKPNFPHRQILNQGDAIASIIYVVNPKSLKAYDNQRRIFRDQNKVNDGNKVKELLLFHGTDDSNIDSILENNFNIDYVSGHKKKVMMYGRGVYLSEHPEISFGYGNKVLLCKVSRKIS